MELEVNCEITCENESSLRPLPCQQRHCSNHQALNKCRETTVERQSQLEKETVLTMESSFGVICRRNLSKDMGKWSTRDHDTPPEGSTRFAESEPWPGVCAVAGGMFDEAASTLFLPCHKNVNLMMCEDHGQLRPSVNLTPRRPGLKRFAIQKSRELPRFSSTVA